MLKKLKEILKEYWNIYSPIIISSAFAWLVDWNEKIMTSFNQWVGITLSLVALLTMVKFLIYPNKKKNNLEKMVSTQKNIKNAEMIIHQEKYIEKKIQGGKVIMKLLKWVRLYWQQLMGFLGALFFYFLAILFAIQEKLQPIVELLPKGRGWTIGVYVAYGLITLFVGIFMLRNQVKWVGIGSIDKATEYINNKGQEVAGQLSSENKKKFQSMLNESKKSLKVANNTLALVQNQYDKCLKEFNNQKEFIMTLQSINAEQTTIMSAQNKLNELNSQLNNFAQELNKANAEVSKLQKEINDYENALKN